MPRSLNHNEGIYTLAAADQAPARFAPPILCVHPFFLFNDLLQPELRSYDRFCTATPQEYRDAVFELLEEYIGPILIMEEHHRFKRTVGHVSSLDPRGPRHFVKTISEDPEPQDVGYHTIARTLSDYQARTIPCIGGYLEYLTFDGSRPITKNRQFSRHAREENLGGCLGGAVEELRLAQPALKFTVRFPLVFGRLE